MIKKFLDFVKRVLKIKSPALINLEFTESMKNVRYFEKGTSDLASILKMMVRLQERIGHGAMLELYPTSNGHALGFKVCWVKDDKLYSYLYSFTQIELEMLKDTSWIENTFVDLAKSEYKKILGERER